MGFGKLKWKWKRQRQVAARPLFNPSSNRPKRFTTLASQKGSTEQIAECRSGSSGSCASEGFATGNEECHGDGVPNVEVAG
jgi:hypothetical protein